EEGGSGGGAGGGRAGGRGEWWEGLVAWCLVPPPSVGSGSHGLVRTCYWRVLRQSAPIIGSPRAGAVAAHGQAGVEEGAVELPRRLGLLGVDEQRLVAAGHVEEEGLVGVGEAVEDVVVVEVEVLRREGEPLAGLLHLEAELEPLVRLEP